MYAEKLRFRAKSRWLFFGKFIDAFVRDVKEDNFSQDLRQPLQCEEENEWKYSKNG